MRRQAPAFLLLALCAAIAPAVQLPYLVKDLNTDARGAYGSGPFNFVSAGERAYFATQSYLETGYSIWTTDGSSEGTRRVAGFPDCWFSGYPDGPILEPLGNLIFFVECRGGESWEQRLWRTDATGAGTYPLAADLAEIHTGAGYSIQKGSWTRTLNGRLYFGARSSAADDLELWSSDGSAEGTSRLAALPSPPGSWLSFSTRAGDRLVLFIHQNTYDFLTDIWSTDGTAAGTVKLASLKLSSSPAVTAGRTLVYFEAYVPGDPSHGSEQLWVTDGTPPGTRPLTQFSAEESAIGCYSQPRIVGDELLFCAYTLASGFEIWRTDGTNAGTFPLSAFDNSSPFAYYADRVEATRLAGSYYFLGHGNDGAYSLWRSQGTPGVAVRVRKIADPGLYLYGAPWLEQTGGRLVFWGFEDGWKLYGSDGTDAGTSELTETCPVSCSTFVSAARAFGDRLLFIVQDELGREQLWTTRGSPETTFPLAADEESVEVESPLIGAELAGNWLFPARDTATGFEPWLADPARARSAHQIRDLVLDTPGITLYDADVRGSEIAFSTRTDFAWGNYGVYRSDGTAAGTVEIARTHRCSCGLVCGTPPADVLPARAGVLFDDPEDCESSSLRSWNRTSGEVNRLFGGPEGERPGEPVLVPWGDAALVFLSHEGTSTEIWRTDGSSEGTNLALAATPGVKRVPFTPLGSGFLVLTIDSQVGLSYFDPAAGTAVDLPSYRSPRWPQNPAIVGTSAYFTAVAYPDPTEIWRSDGTETGTVRLSRMAAEHELTSSFFDFDGSALFAIYNWETGPQLWTSDGTVPGTLELRNFPSAWYGLTSFARIDARALFALHTFDSAAGRHDSELWETDGTTQGTRPLGSLQRDGQAAYVDRFLTSATGLFFETRDEDNAATLWSTRGTLESTRPLWTNPSRSDDNAALPLQAVAFGADIFFTPVSAAHGLELGISDGTPGGTRLLVDLRPGPESSAPWDLTVAADRLYFTANDGLHGRELWALAAGSFEVCDPSPTTLCLLDGRYRLELVSASGAARALPLTATTGAFSLAGTDEPDTFFKLIDGAAVNRKHWLFGAGLVAQPFELRVTDTADGSSKLWTTPAAGLASFGDIDAFPALPAGPIASSVEPAGGGALSSSCGPAENSLAFEDGRYRVAATALGWNGATIPACASALDIGPHEGAFWYFDEAALELVVRLRHDPTSDRVELAVAALTNLGYELRVLDSFTGRVTAIASAAGLFRSIAIEDLYPAP